MKFNTFFASLSNLFATYIYYGIKSNEQEFCEEIVKRMQKLNPKLIWTCCVGNFRATQRFHESFLQIENFFGKNFLLYDFHEGNCCNPPDETIHKVLKKVAESHEKDLDPVGNIRKSLGDIYVGQYWNSAICNQDNFFCASSDQSKLQIFQTELSDGNFVKAWILVK